jgi:hypothetical protein
MRLPNVLKKAAKSKETHILRILRISFKPRKKLFLRTMRTKCADIEPVDVL